MCLDPITAAGLAIATTGYQVYQTNRAAEAAFDAQNQQAANAIEEQQAAAEEEMGATLREYRKARARARVAGGESGAQGQSFSVSLNQYLQDADEAAGISTVNTRLGQRRILSDLDAANSQVRTISGLEAGLTIAGNATSAYRGAKAAQTSHTPRAPSPTIRSNIPQYP